MNAILPGVAGLSRDTRILAALTVIATRADDLLALADQKHVPAEQVRIDALRIRAMADDARRLLVQAHTMTEAAQ
jgi:hypothetical protein